MAFFGWLSVFPLVLAGMAILARFLAHDARAMAEFSRFVSGFFPGAAGASIAAEIGRAMHSFDASMPINGRQKTLAALAIVPLLWSSRAYFNTIVTVLCRTFPGAAPRSYLKHQFTMWALMLGVGALFLLSSALSIALSALQMWAAHWPQGSGSRALQGWKAFGQAASFGLDGLLFFLLYRFAPNRTAPPRARTLMVATLVAWVGWEIGKWGFARFLGDTMRYQATYGALAGVVLTLTWIYFASLLILVGAEAGATDEELKAEATKNEATKNEAIEMRADTA